MKAKNIIWRIWELNNIIWYDPSVPIVTQDWFEKRPDEAEIDKIKIGKDYKVFSVKRLQTIFCF